MKKLVAFLFAVLTAATLHSQTTPDTTDIFYGHTDLGAVTVTGVTGRVRQRDMSVPVQTVRSAELRHVPASNIVGAIAVQPGVNQVTTGSGIAKPVVRGLGFNRIVCIADGVRQEGQQWGDEHGLELDGSGIGGVEIIKGPASLMYGSDAMAGVLIFRPEPLRAEDGMGGNAEAEYQSNSGLWRYSLGLGGRKRGFVWNARWSQQAAHAYKNKVDGYVPGSQHRSHAARALVGLEKPWGHSRLILSLYHLTPSIAEGERDETTGGLENPDGWSGHSYGHTLPFQRVDHYKAVSDNAFHIGRGTLTAIIGYQLNRRREYEEQADECGLYLRQGTLTYDVRYLLPLGSLWKLTAGAGGMFQRSDNLGEERLIPDFRLRDIGLYATASRTTDAFTLSGGLRYDLRRLRSDAFEEEGIQRFSPVRRSFSGLSGSLGGVWHARRNLHLRLNLAAGFRAPTIAELASNGIHEGAVRYETGNASLKAEHSLQADLGLDYVNRLLSASVSLFANRIGGYIYLRRTGATALGRPVYAYDSGDARLLGGEASIDVHPIHSLHIETSFSYVSAVQLHQPAATRYFPLTPPARLRSEVKYELSHACHARRFGLCNAYVSLAADCHLRQGCCYLADGTETPTPSYTLLTFSAGADLMVRGRKMADLYAAVENFTDRAYQPHLSRLKYSDAPGICNPGRTFVFKVSVPF